MSDLNLTFGNHELQICVWQFCIDRAEKKKGFNCGGTEIKSIRRKHVSHRK